MMERYKVTGMSCAACVAHVERAAGKVCSKENLSVSLLTNSITVTCEDSVNEEKLFNSLKKSLNSAGYGLERDGGAEKRRQLSRRIQKGASPPYLFGYPHCRPDVRGYGTHVLAPTHPYFS